MAKTKLYSLIPVKAHYFFFMAAMGPILPFLPVIGKQLGVSEVAMGLIMSVTPILFFLAKPIFGFILDYFLSLRKSIFIALVVSTTVSFSLLRFVPSPSAATFQQNITCESISQCSLEIGSEASGCRLLLTKTTVAVRRVAGDSSHYCAPALPGCVPDSHVDLHCEPLPSPGFYTGLTFWAFVLLMTAGNIGYNVANSVSDAVCFDVLGSGNQGEYGQQRVWGTVGFGLSALLGGYLVDWWSGFGSTKDYSPAFLLALCFTTIDLVCCFKLKLPDLPKSQNILKDVTKLVRTPSIATFLLFASFIGICESFIIFFMFWYVEDLALAQGMMEHVKLLQGLTVAAETLVGEIIFFPLSGRILKAVGYRNCLSLCFLAYSLRLGLFSVISNPWWALGIELLQGPSYALSYTTIVAYASAISPPGTSATMQGIAAGVDDGFGYSVGSLVGGLLYRSLGGSLAFRVFSVFALICGITHRLLYVLFFRNSASSPAADSLQNQERKAIYNPPKEAAELLEVAS